MSEAAGLCTAGRSVWPSGGSQGTHLPTTLNHTPTLPHLSPAVFAVLVSIILIYGVSHTLRWWRSHARMAAAVERVRLSLEAKRAAEADIPALPPRLAVSIVQPDDRVVCGLADRVVVVVVDEPPQTQPQPPASYPAAA